LPFESKAQQGFMHAHPEILGKKGLKEWDEATKGHYQDLPEHAHHDHEFSNASYKMAHKGK
jgi:hypothetical protein